MQESVTNRAAEAECSYRVRHSARAKRLILKVDPWGGVEVVVPEGVRDETVALFVARNREWLQRTRERVALVRGAQAGEACPQEIWLPALDQRWVVKAEADEVNRCRVDLRDRVIHLRYSYPDQAPRMLQAWLQRHAALHLPPWLEEVSAELGIEYARVAVRGQRTRWGSCSRRGHISLNRNLLFMAPDVVRYLMVHELCHVPHPNHSPRFWALVEQCQRDYGALDAVLCRGWDHVPRWAWPGR